MHIQVVAPLRNRVLALILAVLTSSCAHTPKQAVALATTVGRDISEVYRAHRELAVILFQRIKRDINTFVDEVYTPYQIQQQLGFEFTDFRNGEDGLLKSLTNAAVVGAGPAQASDAMEKVDIFLDEVRRNIEQFRRDRLDLVIQQETELLARIDSAYMQLHYANSIVTGHLASIVEVHDAQEQILSELGVRGLRERVGTRLAEASNKIAELVEEGRRLEVTANGAAAKIEELKKNLDIAASGRDPSGS